MTAKNRIISEATKIIDSANQIIIDANTLPDDPTTTTEAPTTTTESPQTTTTASGPEPTTTTTEEPVLDSEFSSESSGSSGGSSSGIIPPAANEVPRMKFQHHGMTMPNGMPHGDNAPDYAALPEAVSITSFDQIQDDGGIYVIEAGVTVILDKIWNWSNPPEALVNKGTLFIDRNADSRLPVKTFTQVDDGAIFDAGDHDDPLTGDVEFVVDMPAGLDTGRDPEQFEGGYNWFAGSVHIHGTFVGAHRTVLSIPATAGSSSISCGNITDWQIGDEIILADSRDVIGENDTMFEHETAVIASITGNVIGLASPLRYAHHESVSHVTRNVLFTSPQVDFAHTLVGSKAHAKIHSVRVNGYGRTTTANLNDTIRDHMGNLLSIGTNQRARYPLHFHHCPTAFSLDRCVVINRFDSENKSAVTHHDCEGAVTRNITFGKFGSHFFFEQGSENGLAQDNVAHHTASVNRSNRCPVNNDYDRAKLKDVLGRTTKDFGWGGDGYWFAGPFVQCIGNWASGIFREAIQFNPEYSDMQRVWVGPEAREQPYDVDTIDPVGISGNILRAHKTGIGFWGLRGATVRISDSKVFSTGSTSAAISGKHIFNHAQTAELEVDGCHFEKDPSQDRGKAAVGWAVDHAMVTDTTLAGWPKMFST